MDTRKIALWLLIVAVLFPIDSKAGPAYGLGGRSCAEFAKAYAANPEIAEDYYFHWAQGFMSGNNATLEGVAHGYRDITGDDMAAQKLRIRSYCDAHPLTQYAMAVMDLFNTFPLKVENSK